MDFGGPLDRLPASSSNEPVDEVPREVQAVEPAESDQRNGGTALCLSGGGVRSILFHVGAIWRIVELGLLDQITRVSSVSAGSVVAAQLALNWHRLMDTSDGPSSAYREAIVDPLREFASHTTDFPAILRGILPGITAGGALAGAFSRRLYGDRTLQDLPDEPRFVINAANLGTSSVFRFSKPYAADYRVGLWTRPSLRIADAVAASGAFPPFFAPFFIDMSKHNASFQPSGDLSGDRAYSRGLYLADGSLFDSFAMDAVYHRCHTVLVSDGAGRTQAVAEATSRSDIVRQIPRLLTLYDLRVRNQTYRNLIGAYESNQRAGTYWGMRTDITQYQAPDALPCSFAETQVLAQIPTRLAALSSTLQEGLINWGYAVSDAALRRHVVRDAPPPPGFPFPSSGLGV